MTDATPHSTPASAADHPEGHPRVEPLLSALADPERLRTFARLILASDGDGYLPASAKEQRHVQRFVATGLVQDAGGRWEVCPQVFQAALLGLGRQRQASRATSANVADRVAALFENGRVTSIPRPGELRRELLRTIASDALPATALTESEVNRALSAVVDDHAAVRRYLVDEGFLERANDGSTYRKPN